MDQPHPRGVHRMGASRLIILLATLASVGVLATGAWAGTHFVAQTHTGAQSTSTRLPSASPSPTAAPQVLYRANWAHGAGGWLLPAGWQVSDGRLLVHDATAKVTVPYVPHTASYAIEMDIQVLDAARQGEFGLIAWDAAGSRQYSALATCNFGGPGCRGAAALYTNLLGTGGNYPPPGYAASDFVSGIGLNTYRVTVSADTVDFCPLDECIGPAQARGPLAPARLELVAQHVQAVITRFAITTL